MQSLLMFGSIFTVIAVAAADVGGLSGIWRIAHDYGRVELFKCVETSGYTVCVRVLQY